MVARITVREIYDDLQAFKEEAGWRLATLETDMKWVKRALFGLFGLLGAAVLGPLLIETIKELVA